MSHRKTESEKKLAGTSRKDRERGGQVSVMNEIPKPAKYLSTRAKKIYKEICLHLIKHGALCKIDSHYISGIAHSFDVYSLMSEKIESGETSLIQTFPNGTSNVSPEYSIMQKEWQKIEAGAKNLGLNMKGRDNIVVFLKNEPEVKENDPIAKLLSF